MDTPRQTELETQNAELRRVQAELATAKKRYFDLYDLAPVGYVTVDERGLIQVANLATVSLLGVVRDVLVGQPITRFIFPEDHDLYYRHRQALFETGTPQACDLRMVKPDDTIFWAHLEATVTPAAEGAPVCRVVMHDFTERRRAAADLQNMQKLQSIGTLAGGIAHDFNNILTGLYGNLSLIKQDLAKDHPCYASLEEAEKSMTRAVQLTAQLLTFAKGGAPVKNEASLGALVEEATRFNLPGSPIKFVCQQADDLWLADVDKGQIQQVVSNLTRNAREAMPDGGSLYVTLANADLPAAAIPGLRQGKYVKVTVRDEGVGIAPKHLDQIFDPYFTTKPAGHGLGLATVYSIISQHGGHVGVVSELGKGTTFTLHLPAAKSLPPAATTPPVAVCPLPRRPAKILVMDDEELICTILGKILTRYGFSVAAAPGGQEAIAMYQQAMTDGAPFDMVIMDLTIPGGLGGKEAVQALLAIDPHARAIVSSGYADSPVVAHYADYGFKGVVAKPYTQDELWNVVAHVLNSDPRQERACAT